MGLPCPATLVHWWTSCQESVRRVGAMLAAWVIDEIVSTWLVRDRSSPRPSSSVARATASPRECARRSSSPRLSSWTRRRRTACPTADCCIVSRCGSRPGPVGYLRNGTLAAAPRARKGAAARGSHSSSERPSMSEKRRSETCTTPSMPGRSWPSPNGWKATGASYTGVCASVSLAVALKPCRRRGLIPERKAVP